jgi:hypothetical protein
VIRCGPMSFDVSRRDVICDVRLLLCEFTMLGRCSRMCRAGSDRPTGLARCAIARAPPLGTCHSIAADADLAKKRILQTMRLSPPDGLVWQRSRGVLACDAFAAAVCANECVMGLVRMRRISCLPVVVQAHARVCHLRGRPSRAWQHRRHRADDAYSPCVPARHVDRQQFTCVRAVHFPAVADRNYSAKLCRLLWTSSGDFIIAVFPYALRMRYTRDRCTHP